MNNHMEEEKPCQLYSDQNHIGVTQMHLNLLNPFAYYHYIIKLDINNKPKNTITCTIIKY